MANTRIQYWDLYVDSITTILIFIWILFILLVIFGL